MIEVEAPLFERAAGLVSRAAESGVAARLFGGVAVSTLLGERWPEACRRPPGDIDLAAPSNQRRQLAASMQAEPKSMRWRLRARLGERVRWYELPESP